MNKGDKTSEPSLYVTVEDITISVLKFKRITKVARLMVII